jgi:hypothetical protein
MSKDQSGITVKYYNTEKMENVFLEYHAHEKTSSLEFALVRPPSRVYHPYLSLTSSLCVVGIHLFNKCFFWLKAVSMSEIGGGVEPIPTKGP